MSDSGFSGLPPGTRTGETSFPQSLVELKAKIIEIRGQIKAQRVREKLEGEIIRHNPDGTTRIKTDKGEVTVELRGRDIPPEGAKVEIEIPPGNPPRQVTVRQAAPQAEQTPPPRTDEAPKQDTQQPREILRQTRIDPRTSEDLARQAAQTTPVENLPRIPLEPETVVRLTPLPPAQARDIIQPVIETVQARLSVLPDIILPRITAEQTDALLKAVQSAALQSLPQSVLQGAPQAAPVPLPQTIQQAPLYAPITLENPVIIPPAAQQTLPAPVLIIAPASATIESTAGLPPSLQLTSLPVSLPQSQPAAQTQTPLTLQASTLSAAVPTNITAPVTQSITQTITKPKAFDLRIQSVIPPQIKISAPDAGTEKTIQAARATAHAPLPLSQIAQGQAGSLTGQITGLTPQNLPVLSFFTPALDTPQNFVMQFKGNNLPVGTQINAVPQAGAPTAMQTAALAPFIPQQFFSNFSWLAMDEALQSLQQAAPQMAQALSNTAPNPATPRQIPAAALFFIAAVRSGDISSWLGDKTIDTLRRIGKGDVLNRLTRDVSGMQRTSTEPAGQDWRAMALPMTGDGDIHKMMLYYRHDKDGDDQEEDNKRGTRFIFDLSLSRLGDVQLDGLFRPGKLDLIVRTQDQLSEAMKQTMRRAYISALEQTDISGELAFQNKAEQFVKVDTATQKLSVSG